MVGDDWKDIMCGNKAGSGEPSQCTVLSTPYFTILIVTVLLKNHKNCEQPFKAKPNFAVDSLSDIISLLESTFTVESDE